MHKLSNLPPGCSNYDIERAAGGDEATCDNCERIKPLEEMRRCRMCKKLVCDDCFEIRACKPCSFKEAS